MFRNIKQRVWEAMPFRRIVREWQERKRIEKERRMQALQDEKERLRNLMDEYQSFANDILRELQVYSGNPSETLRARQWFRVKKRIAESNWNQLTEDEVDLPSYLSCWMDFDENCRHFRSMTDEYQEKVQTWFEDTNFITGDIFRYLYDVKLERKRQNGNIFSCACGS